MRLLSGIAVACGLVCAGLACGDAFSTTGDDGGPGDSSLDARVDGTVGDGSGDVAPNPDGGPPGDASTETVNTDGAEGCAPVDCRQIPPGGWTPVEVYVGSQSPACDPGFETAYHGNAQLDAAPAKCSCACGAPTGLECSSPPVTFYETTNCSGAPCGSQQFQPGLCTQLSLPNCLQQLSTAQMPQTVLVDGGCAPQGDADVPPLSWGAGASWCTAGPAASGCPMGETCVPSPMPPFGPNVCIAQAGDKVGCPAGFTQQSVYYGGVDDTRGCSNCTCGSPTETCAGGLFIYSSNACNPTALGGAPANGFCLAQGAVFPNDWGVVNVWPTDSGSCAASAVGSTGSAIPTQPTTVCCP
jgi:hypothetical protein